MGLLLSLVGGCYLLQKTVTVYDFFWVGGTLVFLASLVMVYISSTLYHAAKNAKLKRRLKVIDHIGIFMLIAGTTTPLAMRYMEHPMDWIFISVIWTIGIVGALFKLFAFRLFEPFSVLYYIIMGALGTGVVLAMVSDMTVTVRYYILIGAISYLIGVWFYRHKTMMYSHTIWHLFVISGSFFHFLAIYFCLD